MKGVKIFLTLENSESVELKFDKKYNIKTIEIGEDYRIERWYLDVEIESVDSYFIMLKGLNHISMLKRLNHNSKQDPVPKVAISKIVEVNEVEDE